MSRWSRRQVLGSAPALLPVSSWGTAPAASHGWNVLCVVVDSLPASVIGPHPRDPAAVWSRAMPSLGSLARQGFVLRSARAVHPEPVAGMAALWTGRPGSETGAMLRGLPVAHSIPVVTDWVADTGGVDVWTAGGPLVAGRRPAAGVHSLLSGEQQGQCDNFDVARTAAHCIRNRPPGPPWLGVLTLRGLSRHHGASPECYPGREKKMAKEKGVPSLLERGEDVHEKGREHC